MTDYVMAKFSQKDLTELSDGGDINLIDRKELSKFYFYYKHLNGYQLHLITF